MSSERVTSAVQQAEQELNGHGRVLLRPSGTEPLIRVMVEGSNAALVQKLTKNIADTVASAI
jgi:phosphoglucosamine mutase